MSILLASSFTDSLARLTGDEQKAVKTTAFDLQINPANTGMQFHKLDRARDKRFWSVRVSSDVRLIVHRSGDSLLLCYVDHHDKAYAWAERRKLEVHPATGAAQFVEVRETIVEIPVPQYVLAHDPGEATTTARHVLAHLTEDQLLGYGVPPEWIADALAATEDSILELAGHLPAEAAEALLELATGGTPAAPVPTAARADPFAHPDAQRRFRVMVNVEELARALDSPWEKWSVFLHPAQREVVERRHVGPARVAGSAGTGKTVVALHRAAHLARSNPDAGVLVTTFSISLARMLQQKLRHLVGGEPSLAERITVRAINDVGLELYENSFGKPQVPTEAMMQSLLGSIARDAGQHAFSDSFVLHEWSEVVDQWQLTTWEAYRDVARLGRKTRLGEKQRAQLWRIFDQAHATLRERGLFTMPMVFAAVAEALDGGAKRFFDHAVVDEAQDVSVSQLKFLSALAGHIPDGLYFTGDLGQRIFQTPFSWKSLGVDVRGRSSTLRINYRTSHQIRRQADRLRDPEIADVDGNVERRTGAVSVFNGPAPDLRVLATEGEEEAAIGQWIQDRVADRVRPEEIAVFVR